MELITWISFILFLVLSFSIGYAFGMQKAEENYKRPYMNKIYNNEVVFCRCISPNECKGNQNLYGFSICAKTGEKGTVKTK